MGNEKLIACFQDTLEKSQNGNMMQKTACAIQSNRVNKEGFISNVQRREERTLAIAMCLMITICTIVV